jgi:hypothetical protein
VQLEFMPSCEHQWAARAFNSTQRLPRIVFKLEFGTKRAF